jgi:hypothetical protein
MRDTGLDNPRDFSLSAYECLCNVLKECDYEGISVLQYADGKHSERCVILRHDVDSWPANAMKMAAVESSLGMNATYYFRQSPLSLNEKVLNGIVRLGHEIGYHYEDLATHKGALETAYRYFRRNLDFFRYYFPVKTIAMHGRPLSQWDSKDLWNKYDYRELGIVCEPYLDIDFNTVAYFTDTGNCWDGDKYSVRDHVTSSYHFDIHSTDELIRHIKNGLLPDQIMLNVHPARWNDSIIKWWVRDYILSKPKYLIKKWLKAKRTK